jgi:hypothetical protein
MPDEIHTIARQLGGEVSGRGIICPGPSHSRIDRSLRVFIDANAPGGFRVNSFAGDDWRDCRDYVANALGIDRYHCGGTAAKRQGEGHASRVERNPKLQRNQQLALRIWTEAKPIAGTIAESYLANRIGRITAFPEDLRFHAGCPRGNQKLPALVALLRDVRSDEPKAIQRIYLAPDGSDRLRDAMGKATLGPATGAVCKLSPNEGVTAGLGIAEGVEKGLALLAIGWAPIWATVGTSTMTNMPVLSGIEALTIFADADKAGQRAADSCATRWAESGAEVKIRTPKIADSDWNDALEAVHVG